MPRFKEIICKTYDVDSGVMPLGTIAYKKKGLKDVIAILQAPQFRELKYCVNNNSTNISANLKKNSKIF